jgi:O-antigen/teichoic acid export membrane protein
LSVDVAIRVPGVEKPSIRRQIRGSSLLLVGRVISMGVNFAVQVLIARYLSKSDYGAFAYALSLVALGETIVTLGLDRAVTRFLPIYHEKEEYNKLFGTMMMVLGGIISLGIVVIIAIQFLQGTLSQTLVNDPQIITLLAIMIILSPVQAIDNVLNGLFAVFSRPKAIFFQKYVLGPAIRLTVVILLILGSSDVTFLAVGYVFGAVLGIMIFGVVLWRILGEQGVWQHFRLRMMQFPLREVLFFTVPLLASDLVYVVMNTMDAVLLESYHGTEYVAAFRVVQPTARLNQLILTSFALLFTPVAARLFARDDREGINNLYWQNAVWVAIISFPIFAVTFSLAQPLTLLLFPEYAESALFMALLSFGYYMNAATGQNGLALKVIGKLRYIVAVDIAAAVVNLGVNLYLIPRYGAMGAAVGTTSTLILFNILKQLGLRSTGIKVINPRYIRVYVVILLAAFGLLIVQSLFAPPFYVSFVVAALVSILVLRTNRSALNLEQTFPEILRFAPVRWLLRA